VRILNGRSATQPIGGSCKASLGVRRYRGSGRGARARWRGLIAVALAASGGAERPLEGEIGFFQLVLVRTGGGDGEMNTAHAGGHAGAELE
jgi:hypothetical protein